MKNYICSLVLFSFFSINAFSQDEVIEVKDSIKDNWNTEIKNKESNKSEFLESLRIGGEAGLSTIAFTNNSYGLYVSVKPQITSFLNDFVEGGISTGYTYYGTFGDYNYNLFEFGPIMRAHILKSFFCQIEGNYTISKIKVLDYSLNKSYVNAFVGGGIVSYSGNKSYVLTGIKVNLIKNEQTFNQNIPFIFFSYHFGL